MAVEIKKGQSVLCIKTVTMTPTGKEAFTQGLIYESCGDGCLTNNQGNKEHRVYSTGGRYAQDRDFIETHFKPIDEEATVETETAKGIKETKGKLNYELDFEFITQIAERMTTNKDKYPPYNWQKLHNMEELKQALFRHVMAVMSDSYEDDGRKFGHLEAIALNAMMINYQLKKNK